MLGPLRVHLISLPVKQRLRICALDRYARREESGSPEGIRQSVLEVFDVVRHAQHTCSLSRFCMYLGSAQRKERNSERVGCGGESDAWRLSGESKFSM